jgi:hypothetical protein
MRRQYTFATANATEVGTSLERDHDVALAPSVRLRQVRVSSLDVADVLSNTWWYARWRVLLEALLRRGVKRLVVDATQFARLPTSLVLAREACELGITVILCGVGCDRLTRACALRMLRQRPVAVELEEDCSDAELALARRDADVDMARLGPPALVAAWAAHRSPRSL